MNSVSAKDLHYEVGSLHFHAGSLRAMRSPLQVRLQALTPSPYVAPCLPGSLLSDQTSADSIYPKSIHADCFGPPTVTTHCSIVLTGSRPSVCLTHCEHAQVARTFLRRFLR